MMKKIVFMVLIVGMIGNIAYGSERRGPTVFGNTRESYPNVNEEIRPTITQKSYPDASEQRRRIIFGNTRKGKGRLTTKPLANEGDYTRATFHKGPGYIRQVFPEGVELPEGFEKRKSLSGGQTGATKKEISYREEMYGGAYGGYEGANEEAQQKKLTMRLLSRLPKAMRENRSRVQNQLSTDEMAFYKENEPEIKKLRADEKRFIETSVAAKYQNNNQYSAPLLSPAEPSALTKFSNWLRSLWSGSTNATNTKPILPQIKQQRPMQNAPTYYQIPSSRPDSTRE